jgi:hypothetical protein
MFQTYWCFDVCDSDFVQSHLFLVFLLFTQAFWDKQRIPGEACSKVTPTPRQENLVGIPCPDTTLLHKVKALVLSNQVILEAHNKGIPDNQSTRDSSNHRSSHVNSEVRSSNRAHKEALQCSQDETFLTRSSNKVHFGRLKSSTAAREDAHRKLVLVDAHRKLVLVDAHRKLVLAATLLARAAALLNKDNTHPDRKDNNGVLRVNKGRLSNTLSNKKGRHLSNARIPKTPSTMGGHTQDWKIFRRHVIVAFREGTFYRYNP